MKHFVDALNAHQIAILFILNMKLENSFFEEHPLKISAYLSLAQQIWPAAEATAYLERIAETGYLLVSACADSVPHADALFRQQRGSVKRVDEATYWRRHGRMHRILCDEHLRHLPIRMAPDVSAPAALVWLVPAIQNGELVTPGFTKSVALDETMRREWLLTWARRLCQAGQATRLLVQLPGSDQPAYWFYGNYLGDEVITGSNLDQVKLLLGGLPRYAALSLLTGILGATPAIAEQEQWPLLLNTSPTSWGAGVVRTREHGEILPMGGEWY